MANVQQGYGHADVVGVPFDFYAGAAGAPTTGFTITMQTAILVVNPTGAATPVVVNLPLNPVDGAVAEITSTQTLTSLTVNANTGDSIVNGVLAAATALTPAASASAGSASATLKYRYTLNGFQPASGAAVNPRTWVRCQ
jgi:hypothetical protein